MCYLTHWLFSIVLFNFHLCVNFPYLLLLFIFIPLWSENIICISSVLLNLLRFVLCPNKWSVLKNVPCAVDENIFCCCMYVSKATQNAGYPWMGGIWLGMGSQGAKGVVMLDISNLWWIHEHFIISLLDVHIYFYSSIYFTVKYIQPAMRLFCVSPMFCLQRKWLKTRISYKRSGFLRVSGRRISVCYEHKSGFCTCLLMAKWDGVFKS